MHFSAARAVASRCLACCRGRLLEYGMSSCKLLVGTGVMTYCVYVNVHISNFLRCSFLVIVYVDFLGCFSKYSMFIFLNL
jgi:hypothetical protein